MQIIANHAKEVPSIAAKVRLIWSENRILLTNLWLGPRNYENS
ncbi:MAG: hypothetical protein RIS78_3 [Bacteroidota bacterium]|jgi:hypothetical protein